MERSAETPAGTIEAALGEKRDLLLRLLELGRLQATAITAQEITRLLGVLGDKQPLLDRLAAVQEVIRQQIEAGEPAAEDLELRQRCRALRDQCEAILAEIVQLEASCETSLQQQRGAVADQLLERQDARLAARAYGRAATEERQPGGRLDLASGD